MRLTIGSSELLGPVLIPSISGFETQVKTRDALHLQHVLNEPITLVSAHDIAQDNSLRSLIVEFRKRGGLVFVDSGGYEASRIGKYVSTYSDRWTREDLQRVISECEYDLAASYDIFIEDDQSAGEFGIHLVDCFGYDLSFIERQKLVPVIHLQNRSGTRSLTKDEAIEIVDRVAAELSPPFVAIPERELGNGLTQKHETVAALAEHLSARGRSTKLHILGCGNPLSFAILSSAGAAMADGLEWCRTLIGPNFHLHHLQQFDVIAEPDVQVSNLAAEFVEAQSAPSLMKVLARNLRSQQGFGLLLEEALRENRVGEFIRKNFGDAAAQVVK